MMFTGFWIEGNRIFGPRASGYFYIEKDTVYGPESYGVYRLQKGRGSDALHDGVFIGPKHSGLYKVVDSKIFGPNEVLPWLEDWDLANAQGAGAAR